MEIVYRLVFAEPWRIGSGQGAGPFADDLVRRDGLGLPFVPGTTLRGLAAEALRQLAELLAIEVCKGTVRRERETDPAGRLCGVSLGGGSCPVCRLTGSPHREGGVGWGAARLVLTAGGVPVEDGNARRAMAAAARGIPDFLARPRLRTAIDPDSGRAADERLFSREEAPAGQQLEGRLDLAADLAPRELALLVAALRFVREVGGSRRRGLGGCRVEIVRADLAPAFASWQEAVSSLADSAGAQAADAPAPPPRPSPRSRRPAPALLRLDAVVVGEVAVGGRPEAGNLVPGLPYVPGTTLRGALAGRWHGDRAAEAFGRCFLSGSLRFGFLYPLAGRATALPLPLSLQTCKRRPGSQADFGHGLVDLLLAPETERCRDRSCQGRLTPWGPRLGRLEAPREAISAALELSPHNRIDRGRQTTREAGLFAYETLPDGTRLRGHLRAEADGLTAELLAGLGVEVGEPFRLRVGRRKGALGVLHCAFHPLDGEDGGVGLFPDAPAVPERGSGLDRVRIDLLTPALLPDRRLRDRTVLLPQDLGLDRVAFDADYAQAVTVSGWNSAHRLPKADRLAAAAGSSYLLSEVTAGELATLVQAAREGVGARRVEGYGAVAVRAVARDEEGWLP